MEENKLMNNGFIICGFLFLQFLPLALKFTVFKGKRVMLIIVFNTIPKENYRIKKNSKEEEMLFLIRSVIQEIGFVL